MGLVQLTAGYENLTVFFARHLVDLTKRARSTGEVGLFDIAADVPYIAQTMAEATTARGIPEDCARYWRVVTSDLSDPEFEKMEPVVAREIADGVIVALAFFKRIPICFKSKDGSVALSRLYRYTAAIYPEISMRPALQSMSENVGVWVGILPGFKREVSLLIGRA